jgi:hypothetical protein
MSSTSPAPDSAPEDLLAHGPKAMTVDAITATAPRKKPGLTFVLVGVVAAAVLFAGGLVVGHASAASAATPAATGFAGRQGAGGTGGTGGAGAAGARANGGGFTSGKIASVNGSTITVTTTAGTTVTVSTTDTTTVLKSTKIDLSGLAVGDTVTVVGTPGSSNTVAARAITDGVAGLGGFGGGAGGQAPAPGTSN